MISVDSLSFRYQGAEQDALHDITFTVKKGEWLAVLGHNGSGKSTLAKCLNGLYLPSSGTVTAAGFDTRSDETVMQLRRRVGMVFQNPDNQLVATTVSDDVAFGLENAGIEREQMRKRVKESISLLGLTGLEASEPHRLSGGQKQRVALAGIMALEPDVVILDEATAMLDPKGRSEVLAMIHTLRERGVTIITITHDVSEAVDADHLLVLKDGRTVTHAPPKEVFRDDAILAHAGLVAPYAVQVARALQARGIALPDVMTEEELVMALCTYTQKT
ncbi:energy-coupling factor transporter ATPase [Paenalkalicoccus suaedae]|uniref:Energy-coupling factor transporter ATPase n=1 Tax=Paenalkalicoccus suaedae TaxID=2592382 RepID=A0A859F9C5_9BACI|nr:energy-coupling factor transporter ATPase [Paenalkalicoccus suaedae]QKS69703.1 energy-coupling factor transporter ATPase [Paenalkalicoccus suaedae]